MQYPITPELKRIEPYSWWEGAFNKEELDWLQQKAKEADQQAQVGGDEAATNLEIRRTKLNWLHNDEDNEIIFERLGHIVSNLNANYYGFDIMGFGEPLQLANYHENKQGMYTWHQDFGQGVSRKLSLVLQLSEPDEYEGGELQLLCKKEPISIQKQRGLITVFPSWTLHQVTPVIKGSRQSLVAWVSGAPFK